MFFVNFGRIQKKTDWPWSFCLGRRYSYWIILKSPLPQKILRRMKSVRWHSKKSRTLPNPKKAPIRQQMMAKFLLWEIKTNWKAPAPQVNKIPKSPKPEIQDTLSPETLTSGTIPCKYKEIHHPLDFLRRGREFIQAPSNSTFQRGIPK